MLIFSIGLLITSCNINTVDNNTASKDNIFIKKNEPFTLILLQNEPRVTFYDESKRNTNMYMHYVDTTETQLREKGFDINIDIVLGDTVEDIRKACKEYVKSKIGRNENIAFQSIYFSKDELKELAYSGQIMEISDIYKRNAPSYYYNTFKNDYIKHYLETSSSKYLVDVQDKNKIYGIPIGTIQFFDYTALLVRKEIAEEYGKDIDTIDDYENLLKWIKNNEKQYKPGLFPIDVLENVLIGQYPCYNFWVHVNGYSDIAGMTGYLGNLKYYYKNNSIDSIIKAGSLDVLEITQIPDFKEYILRLRKWFDDRLVDFWMQDNFKDINPNDYATIITNVCNYMCTDFIKYKHALVNAEAYNMYFFRESSMKYSSSKVFEPYSEVLYISQNTKNAGTILNFIEWLYKEQENYDLFMYGKKDVDYKVNNDRITFLEDSSRAIWGEKQFSVFQNYNFERARNLHPNNWEDILIKISKVPEQSRLSLCDYVLENMEHSKEELNELYSKCKYNIRDNNKDLYFNIIIKQSEFFSEMFKNKDSNPEKVLNKYINDINNTQEIRNEIQKEKDGYLKYINELFKCLKDIQD